MTESTDDVEDVELDLQRDVLQTLHDNLVHGIRAVDVCSKLFTVGLLTEREQSDILAQAKFSPADATEMIVSALRRLHKGKDTSSVLYRALKKIRGYEDIAERIRQAFHSKGIEVAELPPSSSSSPSPPPVGSLDLPLPQLATTDNDSLRQGQVTENVSPDFFWSERQSLNDILSSPVPGEVVLPTSPEHVYEPSDVEDLNTPFGRLMGKAYETVCALSPGKLGGLCRLLSTILKKNKFDKGVNIEENHRTVAKLVTSTDQDFVNHFYLSQSIQMIGDPDLSRMLQQYEVKLKDHKEKCIYSHDPLPGKRKLCIEEDSVLLRMGHKQKPREEFQLDHVITELDFLRKIVATERIKFEGFTSGSVYLYFSMPKEAVYVLFPGLEHYLGRLLEWGVTDITVYDYFTFDLDGDTTVEFWPQEIDKKLKSDLAMAMTELEGLKMSQNNKSKMANSRKSTSRRNLGEVVKDLWDTRKKLTESEKKQLRLEEYVEELEKKLNSDPSEEMDSAQRDSHSVTDLQSGVDTSVQSAETAPEGPAKFSSKDFMDKQKDGFLDVVAAKAIAPLLQRKEVIPAHLKQEIDFADKGNGALLLFDHISDQGTLESISDLCGVMENSKGYRKMQNFATECMRKDLNKYF